jgi:hypothetical protein
VLGFDATAVAERQVTLVESSPREGLQPRTTTIGYRKPGDPLPAVRPRLFRLDGGGEVAVDPAPFAEAWSADRVHWSADGAEVFMLYNRRGHQQLTIYGIDAVTGAVRTVVEERSETFVDYAQKTFLWWLDASGRADVDERARRLEPPVPARCRRPASAKQQLTRGRVGGCAPSSTSTSEGRRLMDHVRWASIRGRIRTTSTSRASTWTRERSRR